MLEVKTIWFDAGDENCPIKMSEFGLTVCPCLCVPVCVEWEIGKAEQLSNAAVTTSLKTAYEVITQTTNGIEIILSTKWPVKSIPLTDIKIAIVANIEWFWYDLYKNTFLR